MKAEEIAEKWQRNGLVQRSRGTLFHYHCEMFLNGATIEGPPSPEFHQWLQLYDNFITAKWEIFRTELSGVSSWLERGGPDRLPLQRRERRIVDHLGLEKVKRNQV